MSDRPPQPEAQRRFYSAATIAPGVAGLFTVLLDGRPVKTPARAPLAAPRPVAERIAAEWNGQGDAILPLSMPATRLVNTAIDGVATALDAVAADIAEIAVSDLTFYRADAPDGLVAAQKAGWDPFVRGAERTFGVRIVLAEGVMPVRQDDRLAPAVRAALPADPLALAALHQLATLTGSALVALALARREVSFAAAWSAAHVDEDWNIARWGEDAEAAARRAVRRSDAETAAFVLTGTDDGHAARRGDG